MRTMLSDVGAAVAATLLAAGAALAVTPPSNTTKPYFDSRLPTDEKARGGFRLRTPTARQESAAAALGRQIPGVVWRWDGLSASPRWISAPPGLTLAPASALAREDAALAFLQGNLALLGLERAELDGLLVSSVVLAPEGDAHVHFLQKADGLEVFGARANVNFHPDGSILSAGARLFAGIRSLVAPDLSASQAALAAQIDVLPHIPFPGAIRSEQRDGERRTEFDAAGFGRAPTARLVVFPVRDGARLAWEVTLAAPTLETDYLVLVDAVDGAILFRVNRTLYASAKVLNSGFPDPQSEELAPAQHLVQTIPSATPFSPVGWITAPGATLSGNNATAHLNYWTGPVLAEASGAYEYSFDTSRASLTNAWWWVNDAHDRFYALGFNEAAGNFQTDNFGFGGAGGDPMKVVQWTLGGRNNAFYTPTADGGVATVNFLWVDCLDCTDHDGYPENGGERSTGFMRDVVVHEYGHGVSTRVVGGPAASDCLNGVQSGAMGEGWSDLFAASFFNDPRIGDHFYEGSGWMRDLRHDLTYSELCDVADSGCQVHSDGQIWAGTLWDLRQSIIAADPVNGLGQFHQIVFSGMTNTACYPDFLDARDGILAADTTLFGSSHHQIIWNVFARRKMGATASSTGENDTAPVTSTSVPGGMACSAPGAPTGLTAAQSGPNSVLLSYSAPGASIVEIWREDVRSAFDAPAVVGYTTSTTSYTDATVHGDGNQYRYYVVALGAGGVSSCRSAISATATATMTGGACSAWPVFEPKTGASDSGCNVTLSWVPAKKGCITYDSEVSYSVYRDERPGFEPSERTLIGRTSAASFLDAPPEGVTSGGAFYYLVLAQTGPATDPADHRRRGSAQLLTWVPRIPTTSVRASAQFWDFDAGPAGWTTDNSADPAGAWTLATSTPATRYGDAPLAPHTTAGASGSSWFTGQGNTSVTSNDSDGLDKLISPTFDGTGGRTLLSFDYYCHIPGLYRGGVVLQVSNGVNTASHFVAGLMTTQAFDLAAGQPRGWQRAEIDLARLVAPTSTMQITFVGDPGGPLSEFGVDNVRVEQAFACSQSDLSIQSVAVDDTPPGWGNGNGVLDPGETARLWVTLVNNGAADAFDVTGTLMAWPLGVIVHEEADLFPGIAGFGGTGVSVGTGFTITAPTTFGCGETVGFDFAFADLAGVVATDGWVLEGGRVVASTVFSDTFATDLGWTKGGVAAGRGVWQRGDPVGTTSGGFQANPETDSPNDADAFCYVTENGPVGGAAANNDVDGTGGAYTYLQSPPFSLAGYKRASVEFDLWYFDNSSSRSYWEDYGEVQVYINDGQINDFNWHAQGDRTPAGWQTIQWDLDIPMVPDTRFYVFALDQDASWCGGCLDDVVEMGLDRVSITGESMVCDPTGITQPPNEVLTLWLSASLPGLVELTWAPPVVDASHDAAAHYELWKSPIPSGGFTRWDTMTISYATRPQPGPSEFYTINALNNAGESGYFPTP